MGYWRIASNQGTNMKLPETPAEVAALIGSNYASMLQSGEEPTADTKYVLSIHDLLSAFAELERESEDEAPGSTGEAAELKTVVADAIAVMCANGDLPGEFEDVADWIALGALPIQAVKYEDGNGALRQSPEKCGKLSEPGVPAAVWLNGKRYVLDTEPAHTARRGPLTTAEIEKLLALWDYHLHGDRARYLVREAEKVHGITKGDK